VTGRDRGGARARRSIGIKSKWGSLGFVGWLRSHLWLRASHAALADLKRELGLRDVRSPLTNDMLRPPPRDRGVIQFQSMLTDADFVRLGEWLSQYPQMTLRAYGSYDGSIRHLEFLRFFPFLRRFSVDAVYQSLESIDGLRYLPDSAEKITIGRTKRRLDLAVLERFNALQSLQVEGQTKNIAVISRLTSLEELTLRSITLPDLSLLVPLDHLLSLGIKLGGTNDLRLLPHLSRLRYLELWRIRGMTDVTAVGQLADLRYLFLQTLNRVDTLPDLSAATRLRRVHLETMRSLHDLQPLAYAPALEELLLVDMPQLLLGDLRPLKESRSLRRVAVGLGSFPRNLAARDLLGLPDVTVGFDWRAD
jgi:hypothetical protein